MRIKTKTSQVSRRGPSRVMLVFIALSLIVSLYTTTANAWWILSNCKTINIMGYTYQVCYYNEGYCYFFSWGYYCYEYSGW
jgi:hypothetical protein